MSKELNALTTKLGEIEDEQGLVPAIEYLDNIIFQLEVYRSNILGLENNWSDE